MKLTNKGKRASIAFVLIFIAFYILNVFTPLFSDDFMYRFTFENNGAADPLKPITSLRDVFYSQYNHYFTYNGRVVVHLLVQTFLGLFNKSIFDLANSIIYILFVFLVSTYTLGRISYKNIVLIAALTFLLLPSFDNCMLWLTGSLNYLWSATLVVGFLLLFRKRKNNAINKLSILLLPASLMVGWTHEAFTLPLVISLILLEWKTIINKKEGGLMILGLAIGVALCVFSPGTFTRAANGDGQGIVKMIMLKLYYGAKVILQLKCLYLAILLLFLSKFKNKKSFKILFQENTILIISMIFSLGIVIVAGFNTTRTAFAAEVYSLLLALSLANKLEVSNETKNVCVAGITSFAIVVYIPVCFYAYQNYCESRNIERQLSMGESYIISTNEVHEPSILKDYIQKELVDEDNEFYLSYSPNQYHNKYICSIYQRDSVVFLPEEFINMCKVNAHQFDKINTNLNLPFYALHIHSKYPNDVYYILSASRAEDNTFIKKLLLGVSASLDTQEIETNKWHVISIGSEKFLIVGKSHSIGQRVIDIRVK